MHNVNRFQGNQTKNSHPPGRIKIANALKQLLNEKDFNSITTAEISKTAGVNEALIYKYFENKRGLLHQLLADYFDTFTSQLRLELETTNGAVNKLRKLVWRHIDLYAQDRVIAKILLLEARNFPGYFDSEAYELIKDYAGYIMAIIHEGIEKGEIRDDISPRQIRDVILGSIEHFCMAAVIFERQIDSLALADGLCSLVFDGIVKRC